MVGTFYYVFREMCLIIANLKLFVVVNKRLSIYLVMKNRLCLKKICIGVDLYHLETRNKVKQHQWKDWRAIFGSCIKRGPNLGCNEREEQV